MAINKKAIAPELLTIVNELEALDDQTKASPFTRRTIHRMLSAVECDHPAPDRPLAFYGLPANKHRLTGAGVPATFDHVLCADHSHHYAPGKRPTDYVALVDGESGRCAVCRAEKL